METFKGRLRQRHQRVGFSGRRDYNFDGSDVQAADWTPEIAAFEDALNGVAFSRFLEEG